MNDRTIHYTGLKHSPSYYLKEFNSFLTYPNNGKCSVIFKNSDRPVLVTYCRANDTFYVLGEDCDAEANAENIYGPALFWKNN